MRVHSFNYYICSLAVYLLGVNRYSINAYLCARERKESFRLLVVYVAVGATKSVLVFTMQSGKCCENFRDLLLVCMGSSKCDIGSPSALSHFVFTALVPIPDYLVLHIYCLLNVPAPYPPTPAPGQLQENRCLINLIPSTILLCVAP